MNTIVEEYTAKKKKLNGQIDYINKVLELAKIYPDLKTCTFNGVEYLSSAQVNNEVEQFSIAPTPSCINEAPIRAYFYKVVEGIRIYSSPEYVTIGEESMDADYVNESYGWESVFEKMGLPPLMYEKARAYLDENKRDWEAEAEEFFS